MTELSLFLLQKLLMLLLLLLLLLTRCDDGSDYHTVCFICLSMAMQATHRYSYNTTMSTKTVHALYLCMHTATSLPSCKMLLFGFRFIVQPELHPMNMRKYRRAVQPRHNKKQNASSSRPIPGQYFSPYSCRRSKRSATRDNQQDPSL